MADTQNIEIEIERVHITLNKFTGSILEIIFQKNIINDFHVENGGSQTRTGGDRSRWIYSPLQLPLCDTPEEEKYAGERN